ncbi:MAG: hypothetical protein PHD56_09790 [Anaerostipes sp.]|nr:hypothetical protein [Anaerostipes sp.]
MIFFAVCLLSFSVEAYYPATYNPIPLVMGVGLFNNIKVRKKKDEKTK